MFSDRVSVCNSSGCAGTHFEDQADLQLTDRDPPASGLILKGEINFGFSGCVQWVQWEYVLLNWCCHPVLSSWSLHMVASTLVNQPHLPYPEEFEHTQW